MRDSVGVNGIVGQEMTVVLVVVVALALPPIVRGDESVKPSPDHEVSSLVDESGKQPPAHEVTTLIKQAFPYDPAPAQKKEETKDKEPDAQVVTMERFTVVETAPHRELKAKIEAERATKESAEFSIVKGGAILKKDIGKAQIEFGPMGDGLRFNFLRLSW